MILGDFLLPGSVSGSVNEKNLGDRIETVPRIEGQNSIRMVCYFDKKI